MSKDPETSASAKSTDSLLAQGHTPDYGINDSQELSYRARRAVQSDNPERWHVVAFCALTACLASMVAGMSLSFSSIIIDELNTSPAHENWRIGTDSIEASLIGVSG